MLETDELVRKANTTTSHLNTFIPSIWGPTVEKNLRRASWIEQYDRPRTVTPYQKPHVSLRSRIAQFLHYLSEKFEECPNDYDPDY